MASNNSTTTDDFGEFEDWVELHNAAETDWDIGGTFISD